MRSILIGVIVVLLIIILAPMLLCEGFTTPMEKARTLREWFQGNKDATYEDYINGNPSSNIVEYKKLRDLQGKPITEVARALEI